MQINDYWWEPQLREKLKQFLAHEEMSFDEIVLFVAKLVETEKINQSKQH